MQYMPIDPDTLAQFFHSCNIDEFAIVPISDMTAPPCRAPADLFPASRTMIVFGKVMPDDLFKGSVAETTAKFSAFKQELTCTSNKLVRLLEQSGFTAAGVTSVRVKDGKIRGSLSLKHCAREAGLGEIGENGLLLSPRFGIRLGLGAVLTDHEIPAVIPNKNPVTVCTHCGMCIKACPTNALFNGGMIQSRCLNITGAIPAPLVSFFFRLLRIKPLEPLMAVIVNGIATRSTPRCSACLVACPLFKRYAGGNSDT